MGQAQLHGATRWLTGVVATLGCVGLLAGTWAGGADLGAPNPPKRAGDERPAVRGNLVAPVQRQLALAFGLAQSNIRANAGCSALFGRFGKNGNDLLASIEFEGANFEKLGDPCRSGVAAFTQVGRRLIRLCPSFATLSLPAAAVILIHEGLHSAGMSEKPFDPNGLKPQEINRLVAASCFR